MIEFDAEFWVAASFVILVLFLFKPIRAALFSFLDARASRIKQELEEIESVSSAAMKLLNEYKERAKHTEEEVNKILKNAEAEVEYIKRTAREEISEYLNKKTSQIMDKIYSHEMLAIKKFKEEAIEIIIEATAEVVRKKLDSEISSNLINTSVETISKKLH